MREPVVVALSQPRATTVAGGAGLIIAATIRGLGVLNVRIPILFGSTEPSIASAVIVLAATTLLAAGIRGETGIVGQSRWGKVALILFGARSLLLTIFVKIPLPERALPAARILGGGLTVLFVIVAVVAALAVVRANVLRGASRWVLVAVAVCFGLVTLPTLTGLPEVAQLLAAPGVPLVMPISILVLGIVYLRNGLVSE